MNPIISTISLVIFIVIGGTIANSKKGTTEEKGYMILALTIVLIILNFALNLAIE